MTDILNLVTAWWWLAPLAGAGLVAYRLFGVRGLLAILTLGAAGGLYTKGKTDAKSDAERKAQADRLRSIELRNKVNDEIRSNDPGANRDNLKSWGVPDNNAR